jgi:nitrogen fixation protein NifB
LLVEERTAPTTGVGGLQRWTSLARKLNDCRAILVSGVGETPNELLKEYGIRTVEMSGFIADGLQSVFSEGNLGALKARRQPGTKSACAGSGGGCG